MNLSIFFKKILATFVCIFSYFLCTSSVFAQENIIRNRFQEHVVPGERITSVKKTPYSGLYEVRVGNKIVYTDNKARFLFIGQVIDIDTAHNYTKARIQEISKIPFSDLPFEQAIKKVNGKGQRVIAIFSDPNCGYCKRLEGMLKEVDNLTIYIFPLNILSEQSRTISRNIWCSANRNKAWDDWMINGTLPEEADSQCHYSDQNILLLAKKFDITGTPIIFFKNGYRITGMPSTEDFMKALDAAK